MNNKTFYLKNKEKYKRYYQENKDKIIEYIKLKRQHTREENKKEEKFDLILTYKDRYIINKLYEFVKSGNSKCFLQKQNIEYFNKNKNRFIEYYHMIKESKKNINNSNELMILGEKDFNIEFCSKKCYENNQLKIIKGPIILTFD